MDEVWKILHRPGDVNGINRGIFMSGMGTRSSHFIIENIRQK
jgi:hypothetical protein